MQAWQSDNLSHKEIPHQTHGVTDMVWFCSGRYTALITTTNVNQSSTSSASTRHRRDGRAGQEGNMSFILRQTKENSMEWRNRNVIVNTKGPFPSRHWNRQHLCPINNVFGCIHQTNEKSSCFVCVLKLFAVAVICTSGPELKSISTKDACIAGFGNLDFRNVLTCV